MWERIQATHPFPLGMMFAITERCNLSCRHCEVDFKDAIDELSFAEITSLLDNFAASGVLSLTLTGGEPVLHPDLEDIVLAARQRRFWIKLKTNATLLDKSRMDRLIQAGVSGVHVSLYHWDPVAHDRFVGMNGAWHRSIAAMTHCVQLGIEVQASIVVMDWNAAATKRLVDLCEEKGFIYSVDVQLSPRHSGDCSPCLLGANQSAIETIMADNRLFSPDIALSVPTRATDSLICQAAKGSGYIRANGDVMPCARLPFSLGNIRQKPFSEIWLASEERGRLLKMTWADLPHCAHCDIAWICARCPAIALLEHGDLTAKSEAACTQARALSKLCGEVQKIGKQRQIGANDGGGNI